MQLAVQTQETPAEIKLRSTSRELCEKAATVIIMDRHDLSEATDLVKVIKVRAKEIDEERTSLVKPFNEGVKQINARFKAILAPLDEAETEVKRKMLTFQQEEERKAESERKRLEAIQREKEREQAASRTLNPEPTVAPPAPVAVAPTHSPTTYGQTGAVSTVKKVWAYDLISIQELAAARPDLVIVDQVKVNQEIRGKGGDIPGLRVYQKDTLQVK